MRNRESKKMRKMTMSAVAFLVAWCFAMPISWAQPHDDKERAELAKALKGVKTPLQQGLTASAKEGKPISAKYEVEEGKLQLSIYTMKGDNFSEVIVDHKTGKVAKAEPITHDAERGDGQGQAHARRGRLGGGRVERALGLGHRLALRLRRREVCVMRDRLRLGDLPGLVIDDHLGELVALHRVDRELQLVVLDFVLRGDRRAFFRTRLQALLERRLDALQRLGQFRALLVVVRLRPTYRHREAPRHEKRHRGHRHLSHFLALPISHRWSCYVFCFNTV